jgi:Carboxypeptidase regulatory-like domain/TonB dependent receptor/TonB-dependent Receptor Plug Domain
MRIFRRGGVWCALFLLVFLVGSVLASELAILTGYLTDPKGLAVPGARVQATNVATGIAYNGETNDQGLYRIPDLPPGTYRVVIQKDGFKTIVKQGVELHVQDVIALNFQFELGSLAESVTVESGTPLVNTESAAVSTVIDRQFVERLPLNGRSFNTLLQLTPGVVITAASSGNPGQFSINGQRTDANLFQVDGVSVDFGISTTTGVRLIGQSGAGGTQAFNAFGGTSSLVSVDAMQEFRIETSTYAPEFGRTAGGQVIISTRAGTNQFHGNVFDYFRNDVLDANDWFANKAGKPRAPERQNDFGGVFGGPVLRDRTFFFFSYEGLRLRQPQTLIIQVPTIASRNSAIPAAAPFLNAYPKPDNPSATGALAPFTGVFSNRVTMDAASIRLDHTFGRRLGLFGRYNWSPSTVVSRSGSLSQVQTAEVNTTTFTLGGNSAWTSSLSTSFRFNYSRQEAGNNFRLDSFGGAVPPDVRALLPAPFTLENSDAVFQPLDGIAAYQFGFGTANEISHWNLLGDVTYIVRTHQLKFGGDYRRNLAHQAPLSFMPQYNPLSTAQFAATGIADFFANSVVRAGTILFNAFSVYAQDTWRLGKRATLTYGFRWELNPAPSGRNGTFLASWLNVDNPAALALAPAGTPPWKTTHANFAPRLGIAYRLTERGDLVIRGGWGIFYDLGTGESASLNQAWPNLALLVLSNVAVPLANPGAVTPSLSLNPPFTGLIHGFDPNLKLPYSHQWNVALEKSFGAKQSLSLTYLGQAGRRQLRPTVPFRPTSDFAPNVNFFGTINGDTSDYNALQVQYKRPLSQRVQALASYTWSHSIDTSSSDANGSLAPDTVFPLSSDRGSSNFDVRHNFTGAVVYDVPGWKGNAFASRLTGGWSVAATAIARSGFPLQILTVIPTASGNYFTRPDLVPSVPVWLFGPQFPGGQALNPAAFAKQTTPRAGTLPRNMITGFGATQFDLSLGRKFAFTERVALQFRADGFNVFNHPNFANPFPFVSGAGVVSSAASTQMLNRGLGGLNALYQMGGPRSLQLSLKLVF